MKLLIKHNNCVQPASAYLMVALTHVLIKDQKPDKNQTQPNFTIVFMMECGSCGPFLLGLVTPY